MLLKKSKSGALCQTLGKLPPTKGCRPVAETPPAGGCHPAKGGRAQTLNDLVTKFLAEYEEKFDVDRKSFADMTLPEAMERAAFAKRPDGKREPHQCRIQLKALRAGHAAVLSHQWDGLSFDEMHSQLSDETGKIHGLGELYRYDTAVRLGHFHGVAPEKVYLHSGTRKGAVALGYPGKRVSLEMTELPKPLQRLKPWQVEDFLCIYKKQLAPFQEPRT